MFKIEKSWRERLFEEFSKGYLEELNAFLALEAENGFLVYPPKEEIFSAFECTPFDKVKAVIVGQDPYHGEGLAHGLSFSVPKGVMPPPSLKNIYKELHLDLGIEPSKKGNLEGWAKQGVLLLNSVLTVRKDEPASHAKRGWERFTDAVIEVLLKKKEPIVFMLWGNFAKKKCEKVFGTHHLVLTAAHPSPFSVTKFLGCKHFSKANDFLSKHGIEEIDWSRV